MYKDLPACAEAADKMRFQKNMESPALTSCLSAPTLESRYKTSYRGGSFDTCLISLIINLPFNYFVFVILQL